MSGYNHRMTEEEYQLEDMNRVVENYSVVEFVAIPPHFDIMNYLSMREGAGIFDSKNVDLKQLKIMAQSIALSPVFNVRNNLRISAVTCLYLIKILKELGVVLKSIPNPLREGIEHFIENIDNYGDDNLYIKGQTAKRVNFTIVNIFPLMSDGVIQEGIQIGQTLEKYEEEISDKLSSIKL